MSENANFYSFATAPVVLDMFANQFSLCYLVGTCWPPYGRTPSVELILGRPRRCLQIFRSHLHRSLPQRNPSWRQGQLDLWSHPKASRIAWSYLSWQELPWTRQGLQIRSNHRRITSRCMAPPQSHPLAQISLKFHMISWIFYLHLPSQCSKSSMFNDWFSNKNRNNLKRKFFELSLLQSHIQFQLFSFRKYFY